MMPAMQDLPNDRARRLHALITAALAPTELSIVDDSARHAGHAGAAAGGQTHYNVAIVSAAFRGLSRVARHRLVHDAVAPELASGLHALALTLRAPEET